MSSKKQKSPALIRVADGTGSLRTVEDHEFDQGTWSIQRSIPADQAEAWMNHLAAETEERSWTAPGYAQLDPDENSGSKSIYLVPGPTGPTIDAGWEKPRGGPLAFRARPGGVPVADGALVDQFFAAVDARALAGRLTMLYQRACLRYAGLPWAGELWLTNSVRLGPPSQGSTDWLERQVVVLDALAEGIGARGAMANFETLRREVCLVLSPIIGTHLEVINGHQDWVVTVDQNHPDRTCKLMNVGYVELQDAHGMPATNALAPVALETVSRPGLGRSGIAVGDTTRRIPHDIVELWALFTALPTALKTQYLNGCNAYSIAQSMWPHQRTAYAAFLVIAIEALKPKGNWYKNARVYDVVASLMDVATAESLETLRFSPQSVRSDHVHRGQLVADELAARFFSNAFADPSFDDMLTALSRAARVCIIEWLRKGGVYDLIWMPRPNEQTPQNHRRAKRKPKGTSQGRNT